MAEYIFEMSDALYDEATGQMCIKPEYKGKLTRCCDCVHFKYFENQFVQMTRCVVHDRCPDYTDFCSWAERKEE